MADAAQAQQDQNPSEARPGYEFVRYWLAELARYEKEFDAWENRCVRIIKRYRDERGDSDQAVTPRSTKYNVLWSNVQTLSPAIYLRAPKPVVERRFLDKDTLARIASMTLERACKIQIEVGKFHSAAQRSVLDYLLCGRGVVWERYEPTYGASDDDQGAETDARPVEYEKVCTDYVYWRDFRHQPARVWEDVAWVAKREWLTRREGVERFGELFKKVPLKQPDKSSQAQEILAISDRAPKACVWEIWDKTKRECIFIAPDYADEPLEIRPDPLHLADFWPCPKPLYATLTNDTLVPIPDYAEYQDQAIELDTITARIALVTEAIRVLGTYDGSNTALQRLLTEGTSNNKFVGVADWAQFSEKMRPNGWAGVWIMPIKELAETLTALYEARERSKQVMYEITGISDIMRGQAAQGPAKTATEQRIKGQFGTLRLQDRQAEVGRFLRDALAIVAEIVAEQFSPELLQEMTGILPYIEQEMPAPPPQGMMGVPPPPTPPSNVVPFPAPGGAPPVSPPGGAMGGMAAPPAPPLPPPPEAVFQAAMQLLKSDKMRTFRIDIETDSTIEVDAQQDKQDVSEMLAAVGGYLEKALPVGQMMPQLAPALTQTLMFVFRKFRAGRDVEGAWQQAVDMMTAAAKNPQPRPPSPEQMKAEAHVQAIQQKTEADMAKIQAEAQADRERNAVELQRVQAESAAKLDAMQKENDLKFQAMMAKIQGDQQMQQIKLQGTREDAAIRSQAAQRDAALDDQAAQRDVALAERGAEIEGDAMERSHELGMEALAAKTAAAKRNARSGGKA